MLFTELGLNKSESDIVFSMFLGDLGVVFEIVDEFCDPPCDSLFNERMDLDKLFPDESNRPDNTLAFCDFERLVFGTSKVLLAKDFLSADFDNWVSENDFSML